jgi:hypothetical protein
MPESIIQDAIQQYEESVNFFEDQRKKALEDIRFAYIDKDQWDEGTGETRRDRPKYTINQIIHPLNKANGAYKQNKITGRVRGWKSNAQKKVADTYTGLIRNIENISQADQVYADAFTHINAGGFSAWRIFPQFSNDDTFDQDLMIGAISDPWMSVWPDPATRRFDSRDWDYCIITREVNRRRAEARHDVEMLMSFPIEKNVTRSQHQNDDTVALAEYWVKTMQRKKLLLLSNGQTILEDSFKVIKDELAAQDIKPVRDRVVERPKITMYKLSGNDQLEDPVEWLGSWIPIVPCYGYRMFIDNEFHYRGKVRFAKDAQRIYNYATSANIEAIAKSPKDPIFLTADHVDGLMPMYKNFNVENNPFLFYNFIEGQPPPFKLGAPSVQQGLLTQIQQAAFDIKATMGETPVGPTTFSPEQSGDAIDSLQAASDLGSVDLLDNLANAVKFGWETLVDALPRYYDTERQERILDPDGQEQIITINESVQDPRTGENVIYHDISQGKYDVVVDIGKPLTTQRREFATLYGNVLQTNPELANFMMDLFVKSMDIPENDKIEERVKLKMIMDGVPGVEPTEEQAEKLKRMEKKPGPAEQMNAMILKENFKRLLLENQIKELEAAQKANEIDINSEKDRAEIYKIVAQAVAEYKKNELPVDSKDQEIRSLNSDKFIKNLKDTPQDKATAPPNPEVNINQGAESN